jgi:hypothetical protein
MVANGNRQTQLWGEELEQMQAQLLSAHKKTADTISDVQEKWIQERRALLEEAKAERYADTNTPTHTRPLALFTASLAGSVHQRLARTHCTSASVDPPGR